MPPFTTPPTCGPFLYIRSLCAGNGVHRCLGAEVVYVLPALPLNAFLPNPYRWKGDVIRVAERVGFGIPLDDVVGLVCFEGDAGVFHTYCWVVELVAAIPGRGGTRGLGARQQPA